MTALTARIDRACTRTLGLAALVGALACGSGSPAGGPDAGPSPDAGSVPDAGPGTTDGGCIGADLVKSLGKTTLLVGGSFTDATAALAAFDVRYLYLAGGIADGTGPCASCANSCTAGNSCVGGACSWWGCWQWDQDPAGPGQYIVGFAKKAKDRNQIPWVTYYELLQAAKTGEGAAEVAMANDAAFLKRYLNDYRFFLQKLAGGPSFVHLEPDLWGYAQQVNGDPDLVPAKVNAANPVDCAGLPDSFGGLGRCMIAMARKYAPEAKVGFHGSGWATKVDVTGSNDPNLDVAGEAGKLGAFLVKAGAGQGDFIAVDASDRDAGFYQSQGRNTSWDATNLTLPNFHRAFDWTRALAVAVGRPVIFWQVPLGNAAQGNTNDHWKDNRVDYFFAHTDELVGANVAGIFFGAGAGGQTTAETDGGNFVAKAKAYYAAGGRKICP